MYNIFAMVHSATATLVSQRDSAHDIIADANEDADGDGIANSQDLCPFVFTRTNISDSDNDGIGDECDPLINIPPFDLSKSTDADADGLYDYLDNCPEVANPDQEDSDADRIGDVCDSIVNPPPITLPKNILPDTGAGITGEDRQVPSCLVGQIIDEESGMCTFKSCPERLLLDEETGLCVSNEQEAVEESQVEEPSNPQSGNKEQTPDQGDSSEDHSNN